MASTIFADEFARAERAGFNSHALYEKAFAFEECVLEIHYHASSESWPRRVIGQLDMMQKELSHRRKEYWHRYMEEVRQMGEVIKK